NLEAQATSPVWPKQCQVQQYDGRCYLMGGNPTNFTVTVHDIHSKPLPTGFTFSSTTAVLTGGEDELNAQVSCTQQSAQLPAGSIEYEREYFCNVILPQTVQGKPLNDTQRTSAVEVVEPPYRLGQPQVMMTFTYGNGKGVSKLEVQGLPGVTYIKRIKTSALLNWEKQLEDAKKLTDLFMSIIRKVMWVTGFCIVCYVSDVAIDGIENKIDSPEPTNPPAGTGGQVAWADNEVLMEQINDIRTIDYLSEAHTSTSGLNDFSYQPEIQEKIFFADGSKFDWGSFAVAMISLAGVIYLLVKFLDRDSALRGVLDTDPKNDLFGHFKKGATWGLSCLIARLLGEIIQRLGGGVADVIGEDVLEGTASAFGDVCGVLLKNWRILILVAQIYLDFLQLQACFENIQRQVEQAQPVGEVNAAYQGINVMQSLASCVANLEATAQKAEQLYQAVEDAAADLGGGSGGQIYTTNRGLCGPNDAAITVYFKEVRRGDKEYRFAYLVVKDGENVLAEELNRKVVPQLTEMRGGKYTGTAQLTFRQHLPDMFIDQSGRVKQGDLNGKQIWIYLENDKGKVSEKLNVGTYYNNCAGDRGSGISDSLTAIWVETGNDGNIDAEIDAIKEIKIESKAGDISVRVSKTCDMTGTVEMLTPETFNVLQKSPGIVKVKGKSKGTCTINIADTDSSTDPSQLTITIKEKPATTGTPAGVDMPSMTLSVKTVDLKAREPNFYVIISAAGGGITHFLVDSVTKDWIKTAPSKDADIATQYSQGSSIKIFLGTHPYAKDDGIVKVCGSTSVDRNNKVESTCQDINVTFEKETAPAAQPTYTSSQAPACNFASCYVTGLCKSGVCCVVKARFGDAWADSMNGNEANTAAQKYWNTNACVTKNFGTCKTARGVSMGDDCSAATSPATVTYNGKIQILTPFHNEKTDAQLLANPDFGTFVVKADGGALQFTILAIPSNEYAVYLRGSKVTSQQTINSGQQETYTVIFTGSNIVPVKIEIQNSNTPSDKKTINYGASSGATFS
ncbi:MAG: hypothetical protein JW716_02100, partial [Candidatus Aenigmarchaeota archaeon]|nr:hypothetical protein [Candidatus Aenigmarchaeota archaeon]